MYYTSYFANIKNIDGNKYRLAAITYKKPSFCDAEILDWSFLGPSAKILNDYKKSLLNEENYTTLYNNQLRIIWPQISAFMRENEYNNVVLLCYEKPPKFCHRHLLAEFLRAHGIACEELPYGF